MTNFAKTKRLLEDQLRMLNSRAEDASNDWKEHSVESADDEVLEKVAAATLEEIRQVKLALARLEAGTYGICAGCGSKISGERLKALPYATRCVKCS